MNSRTPNLAPRTLEPSNPPNPYNIPVSAIVILGAGDLGGALARQLALTATPDRIVLVDDAESVAAGKALDIRQAGPVDGYATMVTGTADVSAVVGARAIIVADRHGSESEEWRDDAGLALVKRVAGLNQRAPIVCAGALQTSLVERGVSELGISRRRLFGSLGEALRSAVVGLTALEAGCAPGDVMLGVLGRPPRHLVIPWDAASVAGHALTAVLGPPALSRLEARVTRLWPPGPYTLAAAASRLVSGALLRSPHTRYVLALHDENDGPDPRAAMWPVRLGPAGIAQVLSPTLTPRDRVRLHAQLGT